MISRRSALREHLVQPRTYGALAGRVAGAIDVGGILTEQQHAAFAVFGEGMQIEELGCRWAWDRL